MRSAAARSYGSILFTALCYFVLLLFGSEALAQTPAPGNTATPPAATSGAGENSTAQPAPNGAGSQPPAASEAPRQDPAAQQPAAQEPSAGDQSSMFVFKKQVQEVVLHATVVDDQGNPVPGLDKSAFTVYEDGAAQPVTSFRREDVPVEMGIVIDNSGSMREKRDAVNQAVLNLIRASNPKDEIFVVNFSQNSYLDQDFTSDVNLLQAAVHQVSARGSTALYDAIVVTDGQDNMSAQTLQEASRRLQQANGPTLYAIGLLGSGLQNSGRDALQQLAKGTGGVAYFPGTLDQVDSITRTIAHDIRGQYMIAYRPKNQNARPEYQSVKVEAHAPGYRALTVRTKTGYYPPESPH
jgi:VWFA-related protein